MKLYIIYIQIFLISCSCSTRNIIYFSDFPDDINKKQKITNIIEPTIQPKDILGISVSTLNPESNLLFNGGVYPSTTNVMMANQTTNPINEGYRVDENGEINFPVLGKIKLEGLTIDQSIDKLTKILENEAKNPIVNIKLLNFKITVIGEVNNPSTINIPSERINIIEALGLVGDMTAYGKRENVLLIREINGEREIVKINLNKSDIIQSDYFYLRQNDIIYIEPVRAKAEQASLTRSNISIMLSIVSVLSFTIWQLTQ